MAGSGKTGSTSLRNKLHKMQTQKVIVSILFLCVPLLLLFTFTYLPFFKMVQFSFYDMKYIGKRTWVGLQNYISVFTREDCLNALKLSIFYLVGSFVQIAIALLFASILSFPTKGGKFFRGALYFPSLIGGIAVGFIFKFFFTHGFVLDTLLTWVGMDADSLPFWLKDKSINNWVLAATSICGTWDKTWYCSSVRLPALIRPNMKRQRLMEQTHGSGSGISFCHPSKRL